MFFHFMREIVLYIISLLKMHMCLEDQFGESTGIKYFSLVMNLFLFLLQIFFFFFIYIVPLTHSTKLGHCEWLTLCYSGQFQDTLWLC